MSWTTGTVLVKIYKSDQSDPNRSVDLSGDASPRTPRRRPWPSGICAGGECSKQQFGQVVPWQGEYMD